MDNKWIVSPSPHIHSGDSVIKNMHGVLFALLPALAVSLYEFGLGALVVTLTAVLSCMFFEWVIKKYLLKEQPTLSDGSAALTGLLLAFNLPSTIPWWIIIIGSLVAIGVAKMSFGGLGNNIFNPALVGRVFLLISFPAQMTSAWAIPGQWFKYTDAATAATPLAIMKFGADSTTTATPLSFFGGGGDLNILDMLLGNIGGSLGEVSAIALLLGLAYMLWKKIITWHIPISILVTVALFSLIIGENPIYQLLSGGLLLGAIFMATDYVTSPMNHRGMIIYGICIGLLTIIIRKWSAYPEGMSFAILIMNAFTPLINTYVKPKHFGEVKK